MSIICAKYRRCLPSFARPGSMRSSGFAIQRICAAPIPVFSGRRLNLISETLWTICALPRKVSFGSPIFMLTCSQRNIAEPSELIEPIVCLLVEDPATAMRLLRSDQAEQTIASAERELNSNCQRWRSPLFRRSRSSPVTPMCSPGGARPPSIVSQRKAELDRNLPNMPITCCRVASKENVSFHILDDRGLPPRHQTIAFKSLVRCEVHSSSHWSQLVRLKR